MTIAPRAATGTVVPTTILVTPIITIFMGRIFLQTRKCTSERKGRTQVDNVNEIGHFDYLLPLSESRAVLEFLHFIPHILNGVPQSLTLWNFMWGRGAGDPVHIESFLPT